MAGIVTATGGASTRFVVISCLELGRYQDTNAKPRDD